MGALKSLMSFSAIFFASWLLFLFPLLHCLLLLVRPTFCIFFCGAATLLCQQRSAAGYESHNGLSVATLLLPPTPPHPTPTHPAVELEPERVEARRLEKEPKEVVRKRFFAFLSEWPLARTACNDENKNARGNETRGEPSDCRDQLLRRLSIPLLPREAYQDETLTSTRCHVS